MRTTLLLLMLALLSGTALGQSPAAPKDTSQAPAKKEVKTPPDAELGEDGHGPVLLDTDGKALQRKKLFPFNKKAPPPPKQPKPVKISENDCPVKIVS